ncbi:apoptosis-associated speck-like protein containing a CARD [Garra rufa]|uniref:apoptosis-associated speck-like protein containing a CARD n=1 Tax=Garra rufa TaxID=137080 RepID=UPI003CCE7058
MAEILLECLQDLTSEDMNLFKWHLSQGINNFDKIPKSHLENKPVFEVVDCMIQRYPDDAGKLTLLILEKMKQMNLAKELQEKLGHTTDTPRSKQTTEAATIQKQERCKAGAEFVEKHRAELIRKVSLVEPIADDIKPLIGDEKYQAILNSGTRQAQMRRLLDFLTTSTLKEKLYQSLVEHERFLVDELEQSG